MRWLSILCMYGAMLACGCDDATPPPPPPTPPPAADAPPVTAPAPPTTRQLLEGPKTRVPLGTLPLSAEVPEGWRVRTSGPLTLLEGPSPSGRAEIQLAHRPSLRRAQMEALLERAANDREDGRDLGRTVDIRALGPAKVLERRSAGRPLPDPATGASDVAYNWTITIFVPPSNATASADDDIIDVHELNVLGLTRAQYEADEPLLRPIVESLQLERAGAAARPGREL